MLANDYIKQLKQINSKKLSMDQSVNIFYGIVFNLINDKEVFTKNSHINEFLTETLSKEYKPYLFTSRPYLTLNVLTDIKKEKSYIDIIKLSERMILFLEAKHNPKRQKVMTTTNTTDWMYYITNNKR